MTTGLLPCVVIDIDGVLADFTLGFSTAASMAYSTEVLEQKMQPTWGHSNLLTDGQEKEVWQRIYRTPAWWLSLPACFTYQDWEMLNRASQYMMIKYMTNRPERAHTFTMKWLADHHLPHWSGVITTKDKVKGVRLLQREYEVLGIIDDSPANLQALESAGLPVWKLDRLYNADEPVRRAVPSLVEFLEQATESLALAS